MATTTAHEPLPSEGRLIWIDLEMTGLDTDRDSIIEIATVVTDANLGILAEGPEFAIAHDLATLEAMDDWNRNQHRKSGLWDRVLAQGVPMAEAERRTLDFLQAWIGPKASPMCGNSICQDRRFMARHMPKLEDWFHYRNLDVSTLKELCKRWKPEVAKGLKKHGRHEALADILESIDELKYYREHFLKQFEDERGAGSHGSGSGGEGDRGHATRVPGGPPTGDTRA